MTARQRILKAEDIVRKLNEQVVRAIALRAMWVRCADKDDVLSAMREGHLTPGFSVVRNALHMDLILTLMRMHESAGQEPASIPHVVEILTDAQVQKTLRELGRGEAIQTVLALFNELPSDRMRRLRQHRDRVLAHNDPRGLDVEPSIVDRSGGDETILLDQSIAIVSEMDRAIRGNGTFLSVSQRHWETLADGFWGHVAKRP